MWVWGGALALPLLWGIGGCGTTTVAMASTELPRSARWVELPIANLTQTPLAGERAAALVANLVAGRHLNVATCPNQSGPGGLPVLDQGKRYDDALAWAKAQGFRYGITGSVEEWQDSGGAGGEPAVGLTLRVVDLHDGRTVWSASGARTGWGSRSAAQVAIVLVRDLLGHLSLR